MRKRLFIWLLLPVVFLASCSLIDEQLDAEGCPKLSIAIEFPENTAPLTRATVGEVPAETNENAIHSLGIWVFYSTTEGVHAHEKVGSLLVNDIKDLPAAGGVRKYSLSVGQTFMLERPEVDVFVLVNGASINSSLGENSTWAEVNDAMFGGNDYFSTINPVTDVPVGGLPMSGVGMGLTVGGEEPFLKVPTVSVGRAVSKLRFIFSQMYTENNTEEEYAIEKVVLNGNQIPVSEYVFSPNDYRIGTDYISSDLEILWPNSLALKYSETPEIYSYAGQDGPSYEKLIKDGISSNQLSHLGTYYLRESDKRLTGTVYYSITKNNITEHKEMSFTMDKAGDFARNHTWTVYGYFISNRTLQLGVSVLPWDKNNYTIKFNNETLQVVQKFTVDRSTAADVVRVGETNVYNVFLDPKRACRGYLYVTTPQGGKLVIERKGSTSSLEAFTVTEEATIDPTHNGGRIDILIDRNRDPEYTKDPTGSTITLEFKAYTPDGDREISGASECIDQIYRFYI